MNKGKEGRERKVKRKGGEGRRGERGGGGRERKETIYEPEHVRHVSRRALEALKQGSVLFFK